MHNPLLEGNYQPRSWVKAHEVNRTDPTTFEVPFTTQEDTTINQVCDSDSEAAARLESMLERGRRVDTVFLFDLELLEAGHDDLLAGGHVQQLKDDWNGHAAGALVMTAYTPTGAVLYVEN